MKKFFILFLLVAFTSCAIHPRFPFICFNKGCVLKQTGFYAARDGIKRAKINASVRRHKRMVKRNIKAGRKGIKPPYDLDKENRKRDSLTYSGGFSGLCKESRVIFESHKNDTVVINYFFEEKEPSDDEKLAMKKIIDTQGLQNIERIHIKSCHSRTVMSEYEKAWLDERARSVQKYLKSMGVQNEKVNIE